MEEDRDNLISRWDDHQDDYKVSHHRDDDRRDHREEQRKYNDQGRRSGSAHSRSGSGGYEEHHRRNSDERYHERDRNDRDNRNHDTRRDEEEEKGVDRYFNPEERMKRAQERERPNRYDRDKSNTRQSYGNDKAKAGLIDGMPELMSIHKGKVEKLADFGAFIFIHPYRKQGLLHISNISNYKVDKVQDVLAEGDEIYVKVVTRDDDNGKYSVAMRFVDQGTHEDLDPQGIKMSEKSGPKKTNPVEREKLNIGAVVNAVCSKCGNKGHLSFECYGKNSNYELISEEEIKPVKENISAPAKIENLQQALEILRKEEKRKRKKKEEKRKDKKRRKEEKKDKKNKKDKKRKRENS